MEFHFIEILKLDVNSAEKDMIVAWIEFLKILRVKKLED